jgi:hypothetical protein
MPSAPVAVIAFIAVSVAIDWGRCVDHLRRRLVHDRRWRHIDWTWNAQINSDVRVSESRAG